MRYLAVDLGDKRTGLAAGDSVTSTASPMDLVDVAIDRRDGQDLLDAINDACTDVFGDGPGQLVVGLPLNMDGTEGDRAKLTRAFAARIGERTGRTVHLHDERKTSEKANEKMARTGLTHKQKKLRRDALAASVLLADFLERGQGQTAPDSTPDGDQVRRPGWGAASSRADEPDRGQTQ